MPFRLAVLAAGALALAAIPCLATPQRPFLTLAEAQARVAADHPDLQRFLPQQDALAAEARAA
ncbi:MAG: TolC family protein, partial [Silanimonas lenta]